MRYDITILFTYYLHILYHLQAAKVIFLKFFLIWTFKDPNLVINLEDFFLLFNSLDFMELIFSKSAPSLLVEGL